MTDSTHCGARWIGRNGTQCRSSEEIVELSKLGLKSGLFMTTLKSPSIIGKGYSGKYCEI